MIPASLPTRQPLAWRRALQEAVTDPAELLQLLDLGPQWLEPALAAARLFPLNAPRGLVARMRRGDPLALSERRLAVLFEGLGAIAHVRRLRIHTRMPIVLPERIDHSFREAGSALPQQKTVLVHANHAR
jgi:L-lysine 2,3-aminomutase